MFQLFLAIKYYEPNTIACSVIEMPHCHAKVSNHDLLVYVAPWSNVKLAITHHGLHLFCPHQNIQLASTLEITPEMW